MELLYWLVVLVVELAFVYYATKLAYKKTKEFEASLQAGAGAVFAIVIATIVIVIAIVAYYISVDLLNMAPPITKK